MFGNIMRRSPLHVDIVVWFEWVGRARLQHTPNRVQFFFSAPSCVMTMDVDRASQIEEFFGGVENPDVSMTGESINQKRQADRSSLPSKATKLPPAATSSQPKGKGKGQRRQVQQSDQSSEELKQTIKLMARSLVRHEDAIQTLRLDTGLVWFAQVMFMGILQRLLAKLDEARDLQRAPVVQEILKRLDGM
eukprot:s12000_g1.t1